MMKEVGVKALSATLALAMVMAPLGARAQGQGANNPLKNIPVTGSVTGALDNAGEVTSATGTLTGALDIERFEEVGGQLFAVGQLSGKVNDKPFNHQAVAIPVATVNGTPTSAIGGFGLLGSTPSRARAASMPGYGGNPLVVPAQSCQILDLVLGPLDLNLLGLVVTLNQVHLNITAQGGNGNLLGNLLCAVVNLLNGGGGGLGTTLTNLLNSITNLLNGILAGL
ncbi:MAG TPA: hypothetical protein VF805_06925 [Anaeromyxobacteraceae bacterium]